MGQNMTEFLMATIDELRAERDTLIRQRAADLEALNAVQKLHAHALAERDEARRQVEAMRALIREYAPPPVWREADALAVPSTNGGG
jgi:hypothetical protein